MVSVSVSTLDHARGWIMVPVSICGIWRGHFLLNTFTPVSSVSRQTATMLGVEGMLGLNFLRRFASVRFDVAERRLTLTLP